MLPTHIKFIKKKDAEDWDRTTKDWIPIETIKNRGDGIFEISTISFAWVSYSNKDPDLLFSIRPTDYCIKCEEQIVEKHGQLCDYCMEDDDC